MYLERICIAPLARAGRPRLYVEAAGQKSHPCDDLETVIDGQFLGAKPRTDPASQLQWPSAAPI